MNNNEIISQALYRKYRPSNFSEVLGQEEVVNSLKNSIENGRIAHAYLFSGGRGSGKTSIARIFARELGVQNDDIYEIDAASNRGIEQIRELRNSVEILPMASDYKVYIIDEAHMLTKEAFNALLKTLEEPPKHVIFILATTEKHKVLDTILSRCQVFDFKKAKVETLIKLIESVTEKEGIEIDQKSKEHIATLGNGSFRDTLSQLQKAISIFGSKIDFETLQKEFLPEDNDLLLEFLDLLGQGKKEELLKNYLKILEKDLDLDNFLEKLLEKARAILLIKNSPDFEKYYREILAEDELKRMKENNSLNSLHLKKILEMIDLAKKSEKPELAMEIFLMEL